MAGTYDAEFVARRWRVGWRHVEMALEQVYTNVALSRLCSGIVSGVQLSWQGEPEHLSATVRAIKKLLDLDLAIIEDAYRAEYMARLKRTERLAALGQVASGIAHELRNPLNVVKTSAYYLLNARDQTTQKRVDHLKRLERNVELADNVITPLSNFARTPIPELKPIQIEPFLREALEINSPGADIELVVDCPADLPHASGDRDQLQIVLGNLIRNARDAMTQGGRMTVTGAPKDGAIEISFEDTGAGIAPGELARIMEPLCWTKARGLADLEPAIGIAMRRFEQFQALRKETSDLKQALEDRKLIEKAKGVLMKKAGFDEHDAFRHLQKLASDKNRKLIEIAQMILTAETRVTAALKHSGGDEAVIAAAEAVRAPARPAPCAATPGCGAALHAIGRSRHSLA